MRTQSSPRFYLSDYEHSNKWNTHKTMRCISRKWKQEQNEKVFFYQLVIVIIAIAYRRLIYTLLRTHKSDGVWLILEEILAEIVFQENTKTEIRSKKCWMNYFSVFS